MPKQKVEPYVWGFIGTGLAALAVIVGYLIGYPFEAAQPLAGGFFTGWAAGHLWNWSGRR